MTRVTHVSESSLLFWRLVWTITVEKKMIIVSSNVQECDTVVGVACSTRQAMVPQRWGFFSCPSFLSLEPWFSCQALKNLVVLHFVFVLSLVLILLISICFDFNASWSLLFFSISSLSAFNLIFFCLQSGPHSFDSWFFILCIYFYFFILYFRILIHFFQILSSFFFITLFLPFSSFILFSI